MKSPYNSINTSCPTIIVNDTPSDIDDFKEGDELGSHERIAKTIAYMIKEGDELNGQVVGLEGGWGTGKSTVITLIEKELAKSNNIKLMSFDAWAHEGDPLRRTFLESIIHYFICPDTSWIDSKKWNIKLLKLSKRRKKVTTKTKQKTTTFGKLFTLSTLLVPLGVTFLKQGLDIGIAPEINSNPNWFFIIGLLLAIAPFMVIAITSLYYLIKKEETVTDKGNRWAFLTGDATTTTKQNISNSPEPTSIEFEEMFNALIADAVPINKNRKFILILDNLDRIKPEDALMIWSTLQIFIQHIPQKQKSPFKNVTVIVPYDPNGLSKLWESEVPNKGVAKSFLDKSFQIKFQVPPLVLSQWKDYLEKLLLKAFPSHIGIELDSKIIYRILNICFFASGRRPTPRELISFVNQIGVIHRQWEHTFPMGDIAYYTFLKTTDIDIPTELIQGELPSPGIKSILNEDSVNNLAALHFNVPPEKAKQLLLVEPIEVALKNNRPKVLEPLKENHPHGFYTVFGSVLENLHYASATEIANASACIKDSNILSEITELDLVSYKKQLRNAVNKLKAWEPINESNIDGIIKLSQILDGNSHELIFEKLSIAVRNPLEPELDSDESLAEVKNRINKIIDVITSFKKTSPEFEPTGKLILPCSIESWHKISVYLYSKEATYHEVFKPNLPFISFLTSMIEIMNSGAFANSSYDKIISLSDKAFSNPDWSSYFEAVETKLKSNLGLSPVEITNIMTSILILPNESEDKDKVLSRIANFGVFLHHFTSINPDNNTDLFSLLIILFLRYCPSGIPSGHIGNSAAGQKILNRTLGSPNPKISRNIVDYLESNNSKSIIFNIIDARGVYEPLTVEILQLLFENTPAKELLPIPELARRWKEIQSSFEDTELSLCNLIDLYEDEAEVIREIVNYEKDFKYENGLLYSYIFEHYESIDFNEFCIAGFSNITTEQWHQELLENNGYILNIALNLNHKGHAIDLGNYYQDGIEEFVVNILEDHNINSEWLSQFKGELLSIVSEEKKIIISRRLLDISISKKEMLGEYFFTLFGRAISDPIVLKERSDVISNLFSPIVKTLDPTKLDWLNDLFRNEQNILTKLGNKSDIKEFTERIKTAIIDTENSEGINGRLIQIAESLEIELITRTNDDKPE